jgi:hypothetical protein
VTLVSLSKLSSLWISWIFVANQRKTHYWTLKTNYLCIHYDSRSCVRNPTYRNILKQNFTKSESYARSFDISRLRKQLIPKSREHALETPKNGLKTHIQTPVNFDLFTLERIQQHLATAIGYLQLIYEVCLRSVKIFFQTGSWCGTDGCQKWPLDDLRTHPRLFFWPFFHSTDLASGYPFDDIWCPRIRANQFPNEVTGFRRWALGAFFGFCFLFSFNFY